MNNEPDLSIKEVTKYVCPICNYEHDSKEDAERCFSRHNCDCKIELKWNHPFSTFPSEIKVYDDKLHHEVTYKMEIVF